MVWYPSPLRDGKEGGGRVGTGGWEGVGGNRYNRGGGKVGTRGGRRRGLEWSKEREEWVQRVGLGWRGQGLRVKSVGLRGGRCGCRGGAQGRGL